MSKLTCQCCGFRTLPKNQEGAWVRCPVCGRGYDWKNGVVKPYWGRPGPCPELFYEQWVFAQEANELWQGASDLRPPEKDEPRDPDWRPMFLNHDEERDAIIAAVEHAFRFVRLGSGTSLDDTYDIDNYREPRSTNTRHVRWKDVTDAELKRYGGMGGLCFMDAEGMRFYMPRYMLAELEGCGPEQRWDTRLMFSLGYGPDKDQFSLLSEEQRQCVARFIAFMTLYHDEPLDHKEREGRESWYRATGGAGGGSR